MATKFLDLTGLTSVLSRLKTLIAAKQDKVSGGASTILSSNLTPSRALISNASGKVAASPVTSTELGYLDGASSNIQTQLNARMPLDKSHASGAVDFDSYTETGIYTLSYGSKTHGPGGSDAMLLIVGKPVGRGTVSASQPYIYQFAVGASFASFRYYNSYSSEWTAWVRLCASTDLEGKAPSDHTHTIAQVSNLQSSLDAKQAKVTGGASTILSSNLTANRALISNASGKVAVSPVTSTELGYLDGVTSKIQTQLNGRLVTYTNKSQGSCGLNTGWFVDLEANITSSLPHKVRFEETWVIGPYQDLPTNAGNYAVVINYNGNSWAACSGITHTVIIHSTRALTSANCVVIAIRDTSKSWAQDTKHYQFTVSKRGSVSVQQGTWHHDNHWAYIFCTIGPTVANQSVRLDITFFARSWSTSSSVSAPNCTLQEPACMVAIS